MADEGGPRRMFLAQIAAHSRQGRGMLLLDTNTFQLSELLASQQLVVENGIWIWVDQFKRGALFYS